MKIYGLLGFTHGWARVMTLMSPAGNAPVLDLLGQPEDVTIQADDGALPRLMEKRSGALQRLVEKHGIELLERPEWEARKKEIEEAKRR